MSRKISPPESKPNCPIAYGAGDDGGEGSRLPVAGTCYTSGLSSQISRAGEWFLRSGIQEPSGGVARYYRADLERNHAVSTEITGYAVSAFVYLHAVTQDERYLERPRPSPTFSIAASSCAVCWPRGEPTAIGSS
jgi:hypothetical protein